MVVMVCGDKFFAQFSSYIFTGGNCSDVETVVLEVPHMVSTMGYGWSVVKVGLI